jgi:hypothetical protein
VAITASPLDPPLPPADLRAEQAVLGALLADNRAYERVSEFLAPEHFADPINGRIYQAIVRRIEAGELADAVTLEAEFERSGVLEELGGTAYLSELPKAGVRRNAGQDGRAIYDTWFHRGLVDEYAAIVTGAEPDAAGLRWVVAGGQFVIDRTTDPTDQSAAADPLRQQLQAAICDTAAELADTAGRVSNTRTWGRLSSTAKMLHDLLAADPMTLPNRLGDAYAAMLRLGGFLETDIRVQHNSKATDDPLDPDIHGPLAHLVRVAAPWLRGFPTVADWDEVAGKTLVRADLFQPAGEFIRIARKHAAISARDAAEAELLTEAANAESFLGQKAGNRAVGGAKNLMLATAGAIGMFLSGAIQSDFATHSLLVQRAGAALAEAETHVEAFAATLPDDLRHALMALLKDTHRAALVPMVAPLEPPEDVEEQAEAMILSGRAPPSTWRPLIRSLNFSGKKLSDLHRLWDLTALQKLDLTSTQVSDVSPLSNLTALQTLNLPDTLVSDVSPLSGLTALLRLDLASTLVSDVSPLSGLATLKSLHLNGAPVSDVSPLSGLTALESLNLTNTQVSDVSPLSGLTALTRLYMNGAPVSDVSPLSGLIALRYLYLNDTLVSDVSPLSDLIALELFVEGPRGGPA